MQAVMVSTLAGSGAAASSNGIGALASINLPCGVAASHSGTFAVATERSGHRVILIDMATSHVSTLAGSGNNTFADGQGTHASFSLPVGAAISPDDSFVLVVEGDLTVSHRVRHIVIATGVVTTLAGNGPGYEDGVGTMAKFSSPNGIALSPDGTYALVTDGVQRVRRVDMTTGSVTTVAGSVFGFADGVGSNAKFGGMFQIAIDPTGSFALIGEIANRRVRRLDIASSQVTTLAGSGEIGFQDGIGVNANFSQPWGVSIDPTGTYALVAEYGNQRIRRIVIATGQVTTLAGTGTTSAVDGIGALATFSYPVSISIAGTGAFAVVADVHNNRIRRIALSSPPCSAGFFCPAGSSSPMQTPCAPGFFCANGLVFTSRGAIDGQGMCINCILSQRSTAI
jgi:DNA-binding beta-propeller fold protein YncE